MPWTEGDALTPTNLNATVPVWGQNAPFVRVLQYGSDVTSIISAISASTNGIVYFEPSAYTIDRSLVLTGRSNVRLLGDSGATLVASTGSPLFTITGTAASVVSNIHIEGLGFDGQLAAQPTNGGNGTLQIRHAKNVRILNCNIVDANDVGIFCIHSQQVLLRGNHINGFRNTGIVVSSSSHSLDTEAHLARDIIIAENYVNANNKQSVAGNGIFVISTANSDATTGELLNVIIADNVVVGANDTNIETSIGCKNVSIRGNTVDGSGTTLSPTLLTATGISVNDAQDVAIVGNTVRNYGAPSGQTQDGIAVWDRGLAPNSTVPQRVTVVGNSVESMPRYGIFVNGVIDTVVAGNVALGSGTYDIIMPSVSTNAVFGINRASSGSIGIFLPVTSQGIQVTKGDIAIGNNKSLLLTDSRGGNPQLIAQSDDNVVFYSTNSTGAALPVWSAFANTSGNSAQFKVSATNGMAVTPGQIQAVDGTGLAPEYSFLSETSLGLYRSGASSLALSYGTLNLRSGSLSVRSTNASATSATLNDGEFRVAAVSVTSAELAYRSGNTTYRFIADATAL